MKQPKNIDKVIATNLRHARKSRSLSMKDVAESLGITYQQVQKYENATNRIPAGRLWAFSQIYKIPIEAFFKPPQS